MLTDDQIREIAPSVFATHAAPDTSGRYAYIPSYTVLRQMRSLGFQPVSVREGKKKQPSGRAFAMHEIRFQRADHMAAVAEAGLGGLIPQALLRNSHDRTSPISLEAGALRVVCLNGMCMPGEQFGGFRVRHAGDPSKRADDLGKGFSILMERLDNVVSVAGDWQKIHLSDSQMAAFAVKALTLKGTTLDIDAVRVLTARRPEDMGDSLWSVYNRAQENITKGGMPGHTRSGRRSALKAISTLAADVDFNRKLWAFASEVADEVKQGSPSRVFA